MSLNEQDLSPEDLDLLLHALGKTQTPKRIDMGWRNQYCAANGDLRCQSLVALGWMKRGPTINQGRDCYYFVTEEAQKFLGIGKRLKIALRAEAK